MGTILKDRRQWRCAAQSWASHYRDDEIKKVAEETFVAACGYMAQMIKDERE